MKNRVKKVCLVLLTMIVLFQAIDLGFVEAAYFDGWTEITSNSAGQTLTNGNYKVTSSRTINTPGAGQNGLNISGTVNLYIKTGVALTVRGGAASGTTGAGAGIHLPSSATLRVYGGGQIIATGGQASAPTQGSTPTASLSGKGGNGGGGAGAGIGTPGGSGGTGGAGVEKQNNFIGRRGIEGGVGTAATSVGKLYVYDTVKITATGGAANSPSRSRAGNSGFSFAAGGNGGYAGKGANIGAGGSGGGGGGSGGTSMQSNMIAGSGGSGGGGTTTALGGNGGTAAASGVTGNDSNKTSGGAESSGSGQKGGAGGNSATGASGGNVYKASSAPAITLGSTNTSIAEGGTASLSTMTKITLDQNGGVSALSSIAGTSGQALPGIETFPTRTGYTFTGYYSSRSGSAGAGTKYINADGSSTGSIWSSGTTIYAGWEGKKYTLTIAKDGISNFTVSGATKVNDTTYTMTYGTKVTLTATPEIGKTFVAWYGSNDTYSSALNPYEFLPPAQNITFTGTAMFGVWVEDSLAFDPSAFQQETFYSTATINVQLDGAKKDMGSVTLENGTDVINVSGANGVYTYKNILDTSGKEYKVFVGGEDTGRRVKFNSQAGTNTTVDYYSTTIRTTLDGAAYNPGTIEFANKADQNDKIAVFYDNDLTYTYYYQLKDTTKTYRVMVNGKDTGHEIDFTQKQDITLDYHTAIVETKVDSSLRDMGTITLRNQAGIQYTVSSNGGQYKVVDRDTNTYDIYLNDVDTKKDVTFNNAPVAINYFTVGYSLVNPDVAGSTPSSQIYKEGDVIKVAGAGNITRPDYHFAGWSDGNAIYPVNSDYTVTKTTTFKDTWEADSDSQATWSLDGGANWHFGTLADAAAVTKQTTTTLKVIIQKSGILPNNTDMTIRNNQSWEVKPGVEVEILGNSKVTNQGTFTNGGILSGQGELINSGQVNNADGVVTVVKITNFIDTTEGLLYGGTYGEVSGTTSVKVVITGGQVKAVDAATKVILGDYSTMNGVRTFSDETVISVMGGTTVTATPTEAQLRDNFGGLVTYDQTTNTIKQTCNLFFRDQVIIRDLVWDSDDNTHEGFETPRVFATVFEAIEKKPTTTPSTYEYVANDGGTVSINYSNSVNGPSMSAEMLVPTGANVVLNATADTGNGYTFVGWYQGMQTDVDGAVTGFDTEVAGEHVPKLAVDNILAESGYYAVFKKAQYTLDVATDAATTAEVFLDSDTAPLASLGNDAQASVSVGFGGNIVVEPKLAPDASDPLKDQYSFLGFMRNYEDGRTEQVIQYESVPKDPNLPADDPGQEFVDVPITMPYTTSAREKFDYTLSTLSVLKGWLHYDMNGGKIPDGSVDKIEDINLLTGISNDFTLSQVVPEKQGWEFVAWERQDAGDPNHTRYGAGATITLEGEAKDAGVLLVAVYKRDSKTQYYVASNTIPGEEVGYKSLDEAVAATKESTSAVFGNTDIFFNAGENAEQVGEVSGTLPNGYTLQSKTSAKLTISQGRTLQIGEETTANANNNKDGSWKTGAHVINIDFINNQGSVAFDGQSSWMDNGSFILYPNSKIQLLSDLNTGNILNIALWDSANNAAELVNSASWKEHSVIVTSDADDGDTSAVDGSDTNFNLMSGRVRLLNEDYSVYNDFTKSTNTGYSLKAFASSKVRAMRTPLDDATLDYADADFIMEYPTIQDAIDDAARNNIGGNGTADNNHIWIVGNSSENFTITGDNPDQNASQFLDYGEQTYHNEVTFVAGSRNRTGADLSVQTDTAVYNLSGKIDLTGVKTAAYEKHTVFHLRNFILSGTVSVADGSYMQVTGEKIWAQDEKITISPGKDVDHTIIHKQVIAMDVNADSSSHFKLETAAHLAGYGITFTQADATIRVEYLGDPVVIMEDLDDVRTIVGEDAIFTIKAQYPTDIGGEAVTPDAQGFAYKWYEKEVNSGWNEIVDATHKKVEFNNGEATLTYTIPKVDTTNHGTLYKCEVYNNRGVSVGVMPVTREASLEVENTPSAFVKIPQNVELRKTEKDTATNEEKNAQDESNMISLQTFENNTTDADGTTQGEKETPKGTYTIKTDPTFDLALTGDGSKKHTVWVLQSDHQTKLPDDHILMELKEGVNEKERFYLRMPLPNRIDLGVYKGQMHFTIDYAQKP